MDHSAFRTQGASHWRSLPVPFYLGLQPASFLLPGQSLYFSLSLPLQHTPGSPVINVFKYSSLKTFPLSYKRLLLRSLLNTLIFLPLSMILTHYLLFSPLVPPTGTTTRISICRVFLHSIGLWSSVTERLSSIYNKSLASVPNTEGERIPPFTAFTSFSN